MVRIKRKNLSVCSEARSVQLSRQEASATLLKPSLKTETGENTVVTFCSVKPEIAVVCPCISAVVCAAAMPYGYCTVF